MRQIPRIPSPTIPQEQRTKPLDAETKALLNKIREDLAEAEALHPDCSDR